MNYASKVKFVHDKYKQALLKQLVILVKLVLVEEHSDCTLMY